jgi:conserved oligomeric Golgi complex subunit 2
MNQNYTTSKAFLSALEYLAPDLQAVQSMREHPIYATFERRWQLPVYFQLRWKEIVGDLEISLSENQLRLSLGIIAFSPNTSTYGLGRSGLVG